MYIHLHGHSHYSLLEAIGEPANIVREAKDYEMTSIALTDYNGLYGAIEFYTACKKAEIKPILGVELWYVHDAASRNKDETSGNIVLLAKNTDGYQTLLELTSESHLHWRNIDKARIDLKLLTKHHTWLIALMWGPGSSLWDLILAGADEKALITHVSQVIDLLWKENVYLEIAVQDESEHPDVKKINTTIETLRSTLELQCICSNNYHYIDETDQEVCEVAFWIKDGKRVYDDDRRYLTMKQHIMNEAEIRETLEKNGYEAAFITQMIDTTQTIADICTVEIPMWEILFPRYESPDEIAELYEKHKNKLIEKT